MATLAVLLVPLALLHAISGETALNHRGFKSAEVDVIVTDAIKDAIRYYNNHYNHGLPVGLPDITSKDDKSQTSQYEFTATEGKMFSRSVKVSGAGANVSLELLAVPIIPPSEVHVITSLVPVTIKGLELQYDRVHFRLRTDIKQTKAPNKTTLSGDVLKAAAKALVGKNKFVLDVVIAHIYSYRPGDNRDEGHCIAKIHNVTAEQFEVKHVDITGLDSSMTEIISVLANHFKDELVKKTYAPQIIEHIIRERAAHFFRYCTYLPAPQFDAYVQRQTQTQQ